MKFWPLIVLAIGCQTPGLEQSETSVYQKDLVMIEGDEIIEGFGIAPNRRSYTIHFEAREAPEVVRISNCHRDVVLRDQKKKITYNYVPNPGVESGSCILEVTFLSSAGRHQFGAIDFREDEELPAMIQCNGSIMKATGASTCQAKSGSIQAIDFSVEVTGRSLTTGCTNPTSDDNRHWKITAEDDFCVYGFRSKDGTVHRLTTFGYNALIKQ